MRWHEGFEGDAHRALLPGRCSRAVLGFIGLLSLSIPSVAHGIVITEIHYHPAGSEDEARRGEFIELFNEDPDPVDLTDYYFSEGVQFQFDSRWILKGYSYLVVCADAEFLRSRYGITNVVGDWGPSSALNNGGEKVTLANPGGAVEASVDYGSRGKWPAGADGTGHTLSIKDAYGDPDSPGSWTISRERGGTPGAANFSSAPAEAQVLFNEGHLRTSGKRWIELYNRGPAAVDLSGHYLSDDRANLAKARIPPGSVIPPLGWLVFEDTPLLLNFSLEAPAARNEVFVALVDPTGNRVLDAFTFQPEVDEASEARLPDGGRDVEPAAVPTPGAANRVDVTTDIVINEIHYHPLDNDSSREFIELFNRGDREIDIGGWRFKDGIQFSFPQGTAIAPQGYFVVARDPQRIKTIYGLPAQAVIGPLDADSRADFGVLANGGERITLVDARGNTADTVKYADGGEWPFWADGGGSTLELLDPWQENDTPQAWDASDDSSKAPTVDLGYTSRLLPGQAGEPEIHVMLLGRGISLVDDLTVPGEKTSEVIEDAIFAQPGPGWRYFKGATEPSDPIAAWRAVEFDDASWTDCSLPIGYGEPVSLGSGTTVEDMRFGYFSLYVRKTFDVPDPASVDRLLFEIDYDDGYVAYLNGEEVSRGDLEGNPPAHDAPAATSRESGDPVRLDLTSRKGLLRPGRNVLALQVHNNIINSPDCFLSARLTSGRVINVPAGWNMVPNGSFEESLDPEWLIQGTHVHSGRTAERPIHGSGSLKVVATGAGDEKINHIERQLSRPLAAGKEYTVSLKARWVVGAQSLLTIGYNFGLARSHALPVPEDVGSPGKINGVALRLLEKEGAQNLGPVINLVASDPAAPGDREPVSVRARVRDPDGVAAVTLRYTLNTTTGEFTELPMQGPDAEGFFTAILPGQPLLTRVIYEIAARDALGHGGRFPLDRRSRTHPLLLEPEGAGNSEMSWAIYGHVAPPGGPFHSYQFWMHKQNEDYLSSRGVHSDDPVEGSFLVGADHLYQDARIRFQGSALSRSGWGGSFRIRMPEDQPLQGIYTRFNLDADGLNVRDRMSNYLIRNNKGAGPLPFNSYALANLKVNSRSIGVRGRIDPPGSRFISKWFPQESDGQLFEIDERYAFSDGGVAQSRKNAYWLYPPATNEGPGSDKESYRFYFSLRTNEGGDDYSGLIDAARLLTPSETPAAEFDSKVFDRLNVEEFCRLLAIRQNTGDWDTWAGVFGRSAYLYQPSPGAPWWVMHWDSDKAYGVDGRPVDTQPLPSSPLQTFKNPFPEVERLLNRPLVKRMYYSVLKEMIDGRFAAAYLAPYLDELQKLGATADSLAIGRPGGFIERRANLIRGWIGASLYPQTRLEVVTNGGQPIVLGSEVGAITLQGTAPSDITFVTASVNGMALENAAPGLSTSDFPSWTLADIPLTPGANDVVVFGFNLLGDLVDTDSITVTRDQASRTFLRGDADVDLAVNLTDAIRTLAYLFQGGGLECLDAADVDDNGNLEITDPIRLLTYLFLGGSPPPAPFPETGMDPTEDSLDCLRGS